MKVGQFFLEKSWNTKKKLISKLIQDLISCPKYLCGILAHNTHLTCMVTFMHISQTNLKTQELNMHGKLKRLYPYIYTEETYMTFNSSDFTWMKSVKDIDASIN